MSFSFLRPALAAMLTLITASLCLAQADDVPPNAKLGVQVIGSDHRSECHPNPLKRFSQTAHRVANQTKGDGEKPCLWQERTAGDATHRNSRHAGRGDFSRPMP